MPVFDKQTLCAPSGPEGDAVTTKYRRLLRIRNRLMEYERLVDLQRRDGRSRVRTDHLLKLLKNESRSRADIDAELAELDADYKRGRRESWKKWQQEGFVRKPGQLFAYCKRTSPEPGPGDLHWGESNEPPSMSDRLEHAKSE